MSTDRRDPFVNARFRVEIDGLPHSGATEIVFPEARILSEPRKRRIVHYGPLVLRRGMTGSSDWYDWWDRARTSADSDRRNVSVVLMDASRADVTRWMFSGALPSAYSVSALDALGNRPLLETLELSVGGLAIAFGDAASHTSSLTPASRGRDIANRRDRRDRD